VTGTLGRCGRAKVSSTLGRDLQSDPFESSFGLLLANFQFPVFASSSDGAEIMRRRMKNVLIPKGILALFLEKCFSILFLLVLFLCDTSVKFGLPLHSQQPCPA